MPSQQESTTDGGSVFGQSEATQVTVTTTSTRGQPRLAPWAGRDLKSVVFLRELSLLPVIAASLILGYLIAPGFLTVDNILDNVLVTSAVLGMVTLAESVILISGNFDISLESTVGLGPMIAVWLVVPKLYGGGGWGWPAWAAILVMLTVGCLIGAFNGLLVTKLRLNAFIVTLAMDILLRGLTVGLASGKTLTGLPAIFTWLGSTRWFGVSVQVWILVIAFVLAYVFMRHHPTGRKIYAVGGNPDAAAAAGIRTRRITVGVFIFGSVIATVAGLMLTSRIASVTTDQGNDLIFTVFAAAVIGGISLNGGRGSMIGAFSGVLLLGIVQNILVLSNVPSFWINAVYGAIILGALILNWFLDRRRPAHSGTRA